MVKIAVKTKAYKKTSPSLQKSINEAVDKLSFLISEKESHGEQFEQIFNNEAIKYDVYKNNFYAFKYRASDSSQLRILYRFYREEDGAAVIEIHSYHNKKKNNKKYIREFEKIAKNYKN